jgi:SAM-dependent methyltransferase
MAAVRAHAAVPPTADAGRNGVPPTLILGTNDERLPQVSTNPEIGGLRAHAPVWERTGRSSGRTRMNRFHRRYCGSRSWACLVETTLLPWALEGVDLGDDVLEVGPGLGVTTRLLAQRVQKLTALEIDQRLAAGLDRELGPGVTVVNGDGAAMPFPDAGFSAVACFTMLHHMPSAGAQDRLFAEAHRVLRPGGRLVGTDSRPSLRFRVIHLFDTMVTVDPATLSDRLRSAGFADAHVSTTPTRLRFAATKAGTPGA